MIKKGITALVAEAEAEIETISTAAAAELLNDDNAIIVDIRDVRELYKEGKIAGAVHAPRGMLEFWADPDSPYHRDLFSSGKKLVFYCAAGWRSALATKTLQDMGLDNLCHIGEGYNVWKEEQRPTEEVTPK